MYFHDRSPNLNLAYTVLHRTVVLAVLKRAKLRWHFYFCVVKQFFNGKYLDAWKVFIPVWGMVKACAGCLRCHISAWVLKRDK